MVTGPASFRSVTVVVVCSTVVVPTITTITLPVVTPMIRALVRRSLQNIFTAWTMLHEPGECRAFRSTPIFEHCEFWVS